MGVVANIIVHRIVIDLWVTQNPTGGAVPAVAAALRANTRNPPSAYLGRNRVPRDGVEKRG